MKNTLRQVFHSSKFVVGFTIFVILLLIITLYPLFSPGDPLAMIGLGTFAAPGTYVSVHDAIGTDKETLNLPHAAANRLAQYLGDEDRISMLEWFAAAGVDASGVDIHDTDALLKLWNDNYDSTLRPAGMTKARRNYFVRLDKSIKGANTSAAYVVSVEGDESAATTTVQMNDYVRTADVANVQTLLLGTDNFGRDMFRELVSAAGVSLRIGLIAGTIATLIGLILGLLAGYVGGKLDNAIMFICNIFTVIPSFVLLILIYYSVGQESRGVTTCAMVIGFTSWVWTARSVRSQVISLRNRDHVNLSKLSGHSLPRIILTDILPYIASYVVMAFILQISSAILAEAQLSLLGLGPKTTVDPTLGLMMNWSMLFCAHLNGYWWAYFPVIVVIALITFSMNLMNTGLDQVFNPTLRE